MLIKQILKLAPFLLLLFAFFIYSCKTKNESNMSQNLQPVSENDISESKEDLMTVDYKEFYDELAPHGDWVEVNATDIGISKSVSGNSTKKKSLARLIGVEDLYSANSIDLGTFFVWKPSDNLEVGLTAGSPGLMAMGSYPVTYVPYTNGQWVNTNEGWYFKAATPYEEIVHHYGRWVYTPEMGWVWMPGRVWAPAWVDWRMDNDYVAWVPIPPDVYVVNDVLTVPAIPFTNYVVVEQRYFVEPQVVTYYNTYLMSPYTVQVQQLTPVTGITVVNNTIINKGPDVVTIEKVYGRPIDVVQINKVKVKDEVKYLSNVYNVYTPTFSKITRSENIKTTVTQPGKFLNYNEVQKTASGEKSNKNEKINRYEEKVTGKNKEQNVPFKTKDDRRMNPQQNKDRENKNYNENRNSRGNENKNKEVYKQNKGNENKEIYKENKNNQNRENQNKESNEQNKGNQNKGDNPKKSRDNGNKDRGK